MRHAWIAALLALATLVAEVAWILPLAKAEIDAPGGILAHGVIVLALLLILGAATLLGRDLRLLALLAISTAAFGPFGAVGTLTVAMLRVWHQRLAVSFKEWYESLFPRQAVDHTQRVFETVSQGSDGQGAAVVTTPFVDVLAFGSMEEKQSAIALMTRHFKPAFGAILKEALHDQSAAVRVQAAAAMARIESRFMEQALALEAELARDPGDPERADPGETLLALARLHDDHAFTGLLDGSRLREARSMAMDRYRQYLELDPEHFASRLAIGRLLIRDRRFGEAAAWIEESFSDGIPSGPLLLWYIESLFKMGRFEELRSHCREHALRLTKEISIPENAFLAVQTWAGRDLGTESP